MGTRWQRWRAWRAAATALAAAAGVLILLSGWWRPTAAAAADSGPAAEAEFLGDTNGARASAGLAGLASAGDLVALAREHSQSMASQNRLYQTPNLGSEVSGWQTVGENVGTGGSVSEVQTAFMNSPEHRGNILLPAYTQVGIGVVWSGSRLWVTEIFRQPRATAAPAPAPVRPRPALAPAAGPAVLPRPAAPPAAPPPPPPAPVAPSAAPALDPAQVPLPPALDAVPVAVLGFERSRPSAPTGERATAVLALALLVAVGGATARQLQAGAGREPGLVIRLPGSRPSGAVS